MRESHATTVSFSSLELLLVDWEKYERNQAPNFTNQSLFNNIKFEIISFSTQICCALTPNHCQTFRIYIDVFKCLNILVDGILMLFVETRK